MRLGGWGAFASQRFAGKFAAWMKSQGHTGRAQWDPMFFVYAGVLFIGALTWLFIDDAQIGGGFASELVAELVRVRCLDPV